MTTELVDPSTHDAIMAAAERISDGMAERPGRDEVNQPTINNWLEAMGLENPRFQSGEAPPSMAQVWTMYGLGGKPAPDDPLHQMMGVLTDAGFSGVLATNSEQTFDRYLRLGERLRVTTTLDSVVGPKSTGMGVGYFVTTRSEWFVDDERVAAMLFRVLKFIPKERG